VTAPAPHEGDAAGFSAPAGDAPPLRAANRGVRAPFLPTRRLALAVLLVAPAWLFSAAPTGLAIAWGLAVLVALAAVCDALLTPGAADVTLARRAPAMAGLDEPVAGAYVVAARWPRAVDVEVHDLPPDGVERRFGELGAGEDEGDGEAGALEEDGTRHDARARGGARARSDARARGAPPEAQDGASAAGDRYRPDARPTDAPPSVVRGAARWRVPAGGERTIPIVLVGRRRGVHPLGPAAVRVAGPLGLVARTFRYAPLDALTVAPSVAGVRRYRLLALQHRLRDAGVRAVRRRGAGTNFAGLREYAVGDDPRHVDWKATARRGAMVSREFTVEQGQSVLIAIDAGRLMTQYAGPLPRFEYALSSALLLADVAAASGDQVGLLVFDDEVRAFVPPARGRLALQRLREALVPVQATMAEPDYAGAFRTLAERHRKRSLLVLFTDVIDPRSSQALIAHVTRGGAHHLPLVVALRDDAVVAAATPGATTSEGVYAAAAAEELLAARAEALERMRRAGASVVDVSPHAMTAAVVNRYLAVKARGAL
jgi:uncharacterized protein (DUF58 family)